MICILKKISWTSSSGLLYFSKYFLLSSVGGKYIFEQIDNTEYSIWNLLVHFLDDFIAKGSNSSLSGPPLSPQRSRLYEYLDTSWLDKEWNHDCFEISKGFFGQNGICFLEQFLFSCYP